METLQLNLKDLKFELTLVEGDAQPDFLLRDIEKCLSAQYELFLQNNEAEIPVVEVRVKQLRQQLERRRSAKTELVKLELAKIKNEALGLVWPQHRFGNGEIPGGGGAGLGGYGEGGYGAGGFNVDHGSWTSRSDERLGQRTRETDQPVAATSI